MMKTLKEHIRMLYNEVNRDLIKNNNEMNSAEYWAKNGKIEAYAEVLKLIDEKSKENESKSEELTEEQLGKLLDDSYDTFKKSFEDSELNFDNETFPLKLSKNQ